MLLSNRFRCRLPPLWRRSTRTTAPSGGTGYSGALCVPPFDPLGRAETLPPLNLRAGWTGAVELGDHMDLIRRQLHRDRAHLLVDVVLTKSLSEHRELALDIGRLLRLQLRRAELVITRTVAGGARWNPARGVPGKNEANCGVVFTKGMPGLK